MTLCVIFQDNWADEFDVQGICLFQDRAAWERWIAAVPDWSGREMEVGFATNRSLSYSSRADWLRHFSLAEVTTDEAAFLRRLLGGCDWSERFQAGAWGIFPRPEAGQMEEDQRMARALDALLAARRSRKGGE